jgi:hypothetical protein
MSRIEGLRQFIQRDAYNELQTILATWPPNEVALYRCSREPRTAKAETEARRFARWLIKECGCDVDAFDAQKKPPIWVQKSYHDQGADQMRLRSIGACPR